MGPLLFLSVLKREKITFTRIKWEIRKEYLMTEEALREMRSVTILGIILDRKVTFKEHIQQVIGRAKGSLNFVFRNSADFSNPNSSMALYIALVRLLTEFAVLVWNLSCQKVTVGIERIQKRFLRYLYYKICLLYTSPSPRDRTRSRMPSSA